MKKILSCTNVSIGIAIAQKSIDCFMNTGIDPIENLDKQTLFDNDDMLLIKNDVKNYLNSEYSCLWRIDEESNEVRAVSDNSYIFGFLDGIYSVYNPYARKDIDVINNENLHESLENLANILKDRGSITRNNSFDAQLLRMVDYSIDTEIKELINDPYQSSLYNFDSSSEYSVRALAHLSIKEYNKSRDNIYQKPKISSNQEQKLLP